jgi:hypothetical protein
MLQLLRNIGGVIVSLLAIPFKWILLRVGVRFRIKSYKDAVVEAEKLHAKTKQKVLVFYSGSDFRMVTKKTIRQGKRNGYFNGESYADIERRAIFCKG